MLSERTWVTAISAKNKVIRHMNEKPRSCILKYLKDTTIIVRSMDIELLNANPNPYGHQTNKKGKEQHQLL